jgi:hypothetical protein
MNNELLQLPRLELISYMEDILDELETLAEMVSANSSILIALATVREQIKLMKED